MAVFAYLPHFVGETVVVLELHIHFMLHVVELLGQLLCSGVLHEGTVHQDIRGYRQHHRDYDERVAYQVEALARPGLVGARAEEEKLAHREHHEQPQRLYMGFPEEVVPHRHDEQKPSCEEEIHRDYHDYCIPCMECLQRNEQVYVYQHDEA